MEHPGVFLGRFQPVHNGHVLALKQIFSQEERVFIVIGSAQAAFTPTNPFTTAERIQMLEAVLHSLDIPCTRYSIIPVPDVHNFRIWVDHITQFLPPFGRIYSGSNTTIHLFSAHKIPVKRVPLQRRKTLSGTEIRRRMVKGENWEALVPREVAMLIKQFDGVQRIVSFTF